MLRITEDSFNSYFDKAHNSTHYTYRDANDKVQQNTIGSLRDWDTFLNKLKERGKKYRLISKLDPVFKQLLATKKDKSIEMARQRARYMTKNSCYLTNKRTYFTLGDIKIPCLVRIADHVIDFKTSERNNPGFQCFINIIIDEKGRIFENNPSDTNIVAIECRIDSSNDEDVNTLTEFVDNISNGNKVVFDYNELNNIFGDIVITASVDGEIKTNVTKSQMETIIRLIYNEIEKEKIEKQKAKEENNSSIKISSVKYDEIKNGIKTETINKIVYKTFVYNGIKYASNDNLMTAYKVKTNGGVSKFEKIDIIHPPKIKKIDYKKNLKDIKDFDNEEWFLFDYNGSEYATNDDKIAYKIVNGNLTNQTLMIESLRKKKLIKLTEAQFEFIKKKFLF